MPNFTCAFCGCEQTDEGKILKEGKAANPPAPEPKPKKEPEEEKSIFD